VRRTIGLDQSGKLSVEVSQRALQDFAMAWVLGCVELLEHVLPGQQQTLLLMLASNLGGG